MRLTAKWLRTSPEHDTIVYASFLGDGAMARPAGMTDEKTPPALIAHSTATSSGKAVSGFASTVSRTTTEAMYPLDPCIHLR